MQTSFCASDSPPALQQLLKCCQLETPCCCGCRGEDAFINNIRSSLEEKAKEYEQQTGIKVNLEIMDPKGNQNTQNSQVDRFLSLEYDAICVNMVDRSAASYVINKAMDAGTPVVFFNREPVEDI